MLDAIGRLSWRHPRKILIAAFLFAAVMWVGLPETRGRQLA